MSETFDKLAFDKLVYAKHACEKCLESADIRVDMHDLTFWASEVERLRKEIKEQL